MNLKQAINKLLKKEEFKKEWCIPDGMELVILRKKAGLTQKQLAEKIGTFQPAISRLENNSENATLKFIGRIAYALGYKARLTFIKF